MSFFSREVRITATHLDVLALNLRGKWSQYDWFYSVPPTPFAIPYGKSWQLLIKPGLYLPFVHLSVEGSVVLQIGLYLFFPREPKPMVRDFSMCCL